MKQQAGQLSILTLFSDGAPLWLRVFAPVIERLLGVHEMNRLYQKHQMSGLSPAAFCQKCIDYFQLKHRFAGADFSALPAKGPVIIVANHPYGGIEGVLMVHLLLQHRFDVKVLSNRGLSILPELREHFIFTNPLSTNAKGNTASLRACIRHLRNQGVLLLFAAGRVSYPQGRPEEITDHRWNRMVASLQGKFRCPLLTVHISGQNRPLFYKLGKLWHRMRLLRLVWEMLASRGRDITLTVSRPINKLALTDSQQQTDLLYLLNYLNAVEISPWPGATEQMMQPVAAPVCREALAAEVENLPAEQQLAAYNRFATYWATQSQAPLAVREIRRLREETFRLLDEGSGMPEDGDDFDSTYIHLFVFDRENQRVIGAFRMGRSDQLLASGLDNLYLSRMFHFAEGFINRQHPCLEMGRSFIVPDQQRSTHGLLLLFLGIGAFVQKFPQYRMLYGTVSLSKQYRPLSVALIQRWLCEPSDLVSPITPFPASVVPQLEHYLDENDASLEKLDWLIQQLEPDGKGLPVLLKHYYKLGARFYCIGIDKNFADTPGVLLSVNLDYAPEKLLRLYLGDDYRDWLANRPTL